MGRVVRSLGNILLSLVSIAICLAAAEFAGRLIANRASIYRYPNYITEYADLHGSGYALEYDAVTGWVPQRNYRGVNKFDNAPTTISADGTRANGEADRAELADGAPILAVGDSFTYGGDVGDGGTWPAALQRLLARRIVNGGVGGYGLDQTVLRAEQLGPRLKPEILLIGMIGDDIARTQMSVRGGAHKPYFELVDGKLELRNQPVPPPDPNRRALDPLRAVLGYSYLVDFAMRRLGMLDWWYGGVRQEQIVHQKGIEVSCALMERAKALAATIKARAILVIQYPSTSMTDPDFARQDRARTAQIAQCARASEIAVLDLYDAVAMGVKLHGAERLFTKSGHMSEAGNALTAEAIVRGLARLARREQQREQELPPSP